MYQNAVGLIEGRLWIESDMFFTKDASLGPDGRWYSPHGVGQPLLSVPLVLAGRLVARAIPALSARIAQRAAVMMFCPLVTALTCAILFLLLIDLGLSYRFALIGVGVYGLATIAWPYSKTYFSDPLSGLLVLFAVWYLWKGKKNNSFGQVAAAGAVMALAILTRHFNLFVAAFVPLFLLIPQPGRKMQWKSSLKLIAAYGAVVLLGGLIWGWHNWARYGHFTQLSSPGYHGGFGQVPIWIGLAGLLVSPGFGLVWYTPVSVLAIVGYRYLCKRERAFSLLALAVVALHVCLYATFTFWGGMWCWGPRFLIAIMPLIAVGIAVALSEWEQWAVWARAATLTLIGISVAIQILACSIYFVTVFGTIEDMGVEVQSRSFEWRYSPLAVAPRCLAQVQWSPISLSGLESGMPSEELKQAIRSTLDYWPAYVYRVVELPNALMAVFVLQVALTLWLFRHTWRRCSGEPEEKTHPPSNQGSATDT
ncbi:MAG: hypothetical protein ACLFWB_05095 [Armatimonadota bacterium]